MEDRKVKKRTVLYRRELSYLDFASVQIRTNNLAREPRDQWVC